MKKIKFKVVALFLVMIFFVNVIYAYVPVYAQSPDDKPPSYEEAYWEFIKSLLVYIGSGYGMAVNLASAMTC